MKELTASTRLAVAAHVRFTESKGEVVVMDKHAGTVSGVDGPGADAFLALAEGETFARVVERVHARYAVPREELEADLSRLVADMVRRGWFTVRADADPDAGSGTK